MSRVVVFGAGQVGSGLARELVARGATVRVVRRTATPTAGVEVVAGDARDRGFTEQVCRGADLVFHCMNPSAYTGGVWEEEFPVLGDSLIRASIAAGAKLVCLDNLYACGVTADRRTEQSPLLATGRKGKVRVAFEARLREEPALRWIAGRAGDFFGPGTRDQSLFSTAAVAGLAKGKAPWLVGDGSAVHAFGYVPDVIAGLVALGLSEETGVWHLPATEIAPAELVERLAKASGSTTRAHVLPGWAVTALSPVVPLFRELRETMYQWDRPFLVDDSRFRTRFPGLATPLDEAVRATVAAAGGLVAAAA